MKTKFTKQQSGFTLVEMALVLVVIGLILGAVSIGKDMQRNAEYKKMKQKFVDQWVQVYNQNYDRLGYVLGDVEGTPTIMVNAVATAAYVIAPPVPSTVTTAGTALCGSPTINTTTDTLQEYLAAAGIAPPPGRGEGYEDAYLYLDSNGNPQQVSICFQWLPASTSGPGTGNVMVLTGLTPDLARFLDSAIDGQVDGTIGAFRRAGSSTGTPPVVDVTVAAAAWPTGNDVVADTDTKQVEVVTGVYRMNQ